MADLVQVHFLGSHHPFNAGEEASFEPARAQKLIDAGIARVVDAPKKGKAETKPAPEAETK